MANLTRVPEQLTDDQVLMCPDIMSTGFGGAERGGIQIGDTVAVFAQGPIGLCATAGARLLGATRIISVESVPARMEMSRRLGADEVIDYRSGDPVEAILERTAGRGVDVAIEALRTGSLGQVSLRVHLASEIWPPDPPERKHEVRLELPTTYERLRRFSEDILRVIRGEIAQARLEGELMSGTRAPYT